MEKGLKHYAEKGRPICRAQGTVVTDALHITCPLCLYVYVKRSKKEKAISLREVQKQRQMEEKRLTECTAHLSVKAKMQAGISWQEARALIEAHTWRRLEDDAGD